MIRLISVSVLLILALPANAWAQAEEEYDASATSEKETPVGTTGEHKSGYESNRGPIGGPNSVPAQLGIDDLVKKSAARLRFLDKLLQPWFDWKRKINEQYGLQLGADYSVLYQGASESLTGESNAFSGVFRIFGEWNLVGRGTKNPGSLVFNVSHRHKIGTDITPAQLGLNVGYLGVTGSSFTDVGLVLVDLNWQQAYIGRKEHPLSEADNVLIDQNKILQIKKNIVLSDIKQKIGEFLGLVKLSKKGTKHFVDKFNQLESTHTGKFHHAPSLKKAYLTDMLQELIDSNIDVSPIFIDGKWCEIDTAQDLQRAKKIFS